MKKKAHPHRSEVNDPSMDDPSVREEGDADDYVYDSMEDIYGDRGEDVIEMVDIGAVVEGSQPMNPREDAPTSQYALVTPGPGGELEPAFDGVIDTPITAEARQTSLARHAPTRQATMIPVEEVTPEMPASAFASGVLALSDPNHESLSQYRLLKIQVEEIIDKLQYRSIAITSTHNGEGKTSVALNLAVVMSENPWLKLALIDLNFRKPDLARMMRMPEGDPGLLQVLSGRVSFDNALKKLEHRNLYFLHTGGQYEASMNVLNSPQFDLFLSRLYEAFDLVIIDAPPVIGYDDTLVIKQKVDGVFMVLRAESTPINEMNKAAARLGKDRILGVVLNSVRSREMGRH